MITVDSHTYLYDPSLQKLQVTKGVGNLIFRVLYYPEELNQESSSLLLQLTKSSSLLLQLYVFRN